MNSLPDAFTDFNARALKLGIVLTTNNLKQIKEYCSLLQNYNLHTNLVGNADLHVLLKSHVLDSLTLIPLINEFQSGNSQSKLVDIGSGAGFPGLILPLSSDSLTVTLIESINKKARFLSQTAETLGLSERVNVACDRAESLAHKKTLRDTFDYATARAVGPLKLIGELCLPFLKAGGYLLAQRSEKQVAEELDSALPFISELGGRLLAERKLDQDVLERSLRILVIKKDKQTPREYPRSAAAIKRELA
ncbi:MAG: 16S rRNA (guanine(527)-N(7))-methyltransferase RsmG [Candidatus Obscuribacterales bacterium]|nr:16S rRNA (guanine(527)-N(7))-methyltransferase RsmG [Candidatus Obscuribacterales bacterium]